MSPGNGNDFFYAMQEKTAWLILTDLFIILQMRKAISWLVLPEKTVSRLVVYRTENYGNIALSGGMDQNDPEAG